jgi:tetratricopeptide (TPR) repeat protein
MCYIILNRLSEENTMPKPQLLKSKDYEKLVEIQSAFDEGREEDSLQLALEFTRKRPKLIEAWEELFLIADQLDRLFIAWQANQQLMQLDPYEENYLYNAVALGIRLGLVFTIEVYAERYLKKFPESLATEKIRKLKTDLAPQWQKLRDNENFADTILSSDLSLMELGNLYVSHGDYSEGRKLSLQAKKRLTGMIAPSNNMSLSYALEGDLLKALRMTDNILEEHPTNLHARCNKVQYLIRLGRADEAQATLEQLKQESPTNSDHWHKILETLAFAGEDAALTDVYERLMAYAKRKNYRNLLEPYTHHLAAVSYARLGNKKKALKLWQLALSKDPDLAIAQQNLRDHKQPLGNQHGAWHFALNHWIPPLWAERIARAGGRSAKKGDDVFRRDIERILKSIAGLEPTLEILLNRGGPDALEFVFIIALAYPASGLKDFVFGKRGTDSERMKAANIVAELGLIDRTQPLAIYANGKQTEVMLLNYEIFSETVETDLPDEAHEHYQTAFHAVYENNPTLALAEAEIALTIVPDHPQLLNVKYSALTLLRRDKEADELTHYTAKVHPDYFFARINMARFLIKQSKLDEADEWIKPLITQQRFHVSEFRALVITQIEYYNMRKDFRSSAHWIRTLEQIDPDNVPESYLRMAELFETLNE